MLRISAGVPIPKNISYREELRSPRAHVKHNAVPYTRYTTVWMEGGGEGGGGGATRYHHTSF